MTANRLPRLVTMLPVFRKKMEIKWNVLSDKEQSVAYLHIIQGLTFHEIASRLGFSKSRAVQCWLRILRKFGL